MPHHKDPHIIFLPRYTTTNVLYDVHIGKEKYVMDFEEVKRIVVSAIKERGYRSTKNSIQRLDRIIVNE